MISTKEVTVGGQTLLFETGKLAKQAGGAVTLRCGDTIILATATMSKSPREGIDWFPLTCDFEERHYAVGKIPGSFFRREGRPGERAILTSRLLDRPLRPLFPDGMRNDVQVVTMTLSVNQANPPDILAINAASAALALSNIPWNGPVGAVRVGLIEGELVLNPSREQMDESDLDLIVVGGSDSVIMVEAGALQVPEEKILEAMRFGHESIREICAAISAWRDEAGKAKIEPLYKKKAPELLEALSKYTQEVRDTLVHPDKAAREDAVSDLKAELVARVASEFPDRESELKEAAEKLVKQQLRSLIIEEGRRPDGRGPEDIRQITCEVGVLPQSHGSGLFTRGQTQVLSVASLGGPEMAQMIDGLGEESEKRYLHHYNFPSFSVGETRPLRGPGRREIGHGALAERAIRGVLPNPEDFPYVIRVVSDVLESNGSTSMASACGSSLALMDAGVPLLAPVSGIAMGLMTEGDKFAVLSDIQGAEDFAGDMDFKVAGSREGVTAIQLDTKIEGIPWPVMEQALEQARTGRLYILDKMVEVLGQPREEVSGNAPRIVTIKINPEKIGALIGPGGKNIRGIQSETGVNINVEQDGLVSVSSPDRAAIDQAIEYIHELTREVEVGQVYTGEVTRLMGKGALVRIFEGKEGLVPTRELSHHPIQRPDDVVKIGDRIEVEVISVDQQGRVDLSRKARLNPEEEPVPEISEAPPRNGDRAGGPGRDRGYEGGGRGGERRGGYEGGGGGGRGGRPNDRDRDRDRGPRSGRGGDFPRDEPAGEAAPAPAGEQRGESQPRQTEETGLRARFRAPKKP